MNDARFRRQHPIAHYIVDFACVEQKLVVELDGGQHAEQTAYDDVRTRCLEACGYRVLRFWDHEVMRDIEAVKTSIWNALSQPPSQPSP
jgi:adenine-specific DNA-methyltransferase